MTADGAVLGNPLYCWLYCIICIIFRVSRSSFNLKTYLFGWIYLGFVITRGMACDFALE